MTFLLHIIRIDRQHHDSCLNHFQRVAAPPIMHVLTHLLVWMRCFHQAVSIHDVAVLAKWIGRCPFCLVLPRLREGHNVAIVN